MSSGKTAIASMIAAYELSTNDKYVVYVSPLGAITDEVKNDWKKYKLFDYYIVDDYGSCDILDKKLFIFTVEKLDILLRNHDPICDKIGTLILDEAHILDSDSRGSRAESMLMQLKSNPRIILLSGTMSNCKEIASWIKTLNNKKTYFYKSNWRPVEVEKEIVFYNTLNDKYDKLLQLISDNPIDKIVVFVFSKKEGADLVKSLKKDGVYAEFLSADVNKYKFEKILNQFKNGGLNCLVCTSVLAQGVNL